MERVEPPDAAVRRWVEQFVVGLGLCPFAAPVLQTMRVVTTPATSLEGLLRAFEAELQRLVDSDPGALPTTLLVAPDMLADFEDYLDALALLEAALADAGLEGEIQVASFHPEYRFADADPDDVAHYTNRAPYPTFHLLREAHVSEAVDRHPDPEGIPIRNVAQLRALGLAGLPFWTRGVRG